MIVDERIVTFINSLDTENSRILEEIEKEAHRERIIRWGPRTLDLDILLYDDLVMENDELIIPHIEMHMRDFVLKPLSEIAPNVRHPIYKKTISQLLKELG